MCSHAVHTRGYVLRYAYIGDRAYASVNYMAVPFLTIHVVTHRATTQSINFFCKRTFITYYALLQVYIYSYITLHTHPYVP
jgi:hypothetical protein